MIRLLFLMLVLPVSAVCFAQHLNMDKIRKDYSEAVKNEELCETNLEALRSNAKTATEKAYLAAYEMVWAKHMGNPFKKMGQFKKGRSILETVIKESPDNIDARFIRWCVQTHAPSLLNYRSEVLIDKNFLVQNLYKLPNEDARSLIYNYLKGANPYLKGKEAFTDAELKQLSR